MGYGAAVHATAGAVGPDGAGGALAAPTAGGPDITEVWGDDPMALFTHLARAGLFLAALQDVCLAPLGISFGDYAVLRVLEHEGPRGALSPTRLAEVVVRTTGGMTKTVDRLERQGLVRRSPDPGDRRGVLVALTPAGRRLCRTASASYTRGRQRLLGSLDDDEAVAIDAALRRLVAVFESDHSAARHDGARQAGGPGAP